MHNIFKEYLITRELFKLNESSLKEIKYEFGKYMDSIKEFDSLNLQNINEICTEEYQNKVLDLCLYLEPTNNSILYFTDKSKCDSWLKYFATTDKYLQFIRYYKYPNFVQYPLYIEEYFKLYYSDYYSELFIKNLLEFNKYYIIPNIEYKSSIFGNLNLYFMRTIYLLREQKRINYMKKIPLTFYLLLPLENFSIF